MPTEISTPSGRPSPLNLLYCDQHPAGGSDAWDQRLRRSDYMASQWARAVSSSSSCPVGGQP